jgi:hypothetical protein
VLLHALLKLAVALLQLVLCTTSAEQFTSTNTRTVIGGHLLAARLELREGCFTVG